MDVGMSAYLRKYPSMSCTSERHIPQALTLTRISSGWKSGTDISSRIGALPYSCRRAAFIFVFPSQWCPKIQVIGRLCPLTKCSDSCLCNLNVLFNSAGTCSDRTNDGSVQNDGYSAAEDDDVSRVGFLNSEERLSRLR